MALNEKALSYLESLWGERLRELVAERDSKLYRVRRGLTDHSDIYAQRGFGNYIQPELDHLKAIGIARYECWLKAFKLDGQPLTPEAVEDALLDAASHMDSATNALFEQKKNEIQSMRPIPAGFHTQPVPDLSELNSQLADVQREAKEQLRRQLTIRMYESTEKRQGAQPMASKKGAVLKNVFDTYTIQKQRGAGGSGVVYEVLEPVS